MMVMPVSMPVSVLVVLARGRVRIRRITRIARIRGRAPVMPVMMCALFVLFLLFRFGRRICALRMHNKATNIFIKTDHRCL